MRFIDIHSHIVPNVTDLPENTATVLRALRRDVGLGAEAVFATPHSYAFIEDTDGTFDKFDAAAEELKKFFPKLDVYLGAEIWCSREDMDALIFALHTVFLPTMNCSRYVLIEFDGDVTAEEAAFCTSQLLRWNFIPILAHVERYENLDPLRIAALRANGCRTQLNITSVGDTASVPLRERARALVNEQQIDFLGSDILGDVSGLPLLSYGLRWLEKHCGRQYLEEIAWKNAETLLIKKQDPEDKP